MAYAKARFRYDAYKKLGGWFPTNMVIYYYKGLGCTKVMFEIIDEEKRLILSQGREWII